LALDSENNLFAWGHNNLGQCGVKNKTTSVKLETPHLIDFGLEENYTISQVAAGADHTLVLISVFNVQADTELKI
jgi:alpha-tubulin suppressor-like RCC1 family protein